MLCYCLECRKKTDNESTRSVKTRNNGFIKLCRLW